MNLQNGFFRLTLVLSVLAGISLLYLAGDYRYKIYTVERNIIEYLGPLTPPLPEGFVLDKPEPLPNEKNNVKGNSIGKNSKPIPEKAPKATTFTFNWFKKTEPTTADCEAIFLAVEEMKQGISKNTVAELLQKIRSKYHAYYDLSDYVLLNKLAKKYPAWKDVLKRWENAPKEITPEGRLPLDLFAEDSSFTTTYTILKIENRIKWIRLILVGSTGFASVWLVYAFIRWVLIGFIIRGFKDKSTS